MQNLCKRKDKRVLKNKTGKKKPSVQGEGIFCLLFRETDFCPLHGLNPSQGVFQQFVRR